MGKIRRQHRGKTKLEAAIAMISGKSTVSELSQKYGVHPTVLQRWKNELLEGSLEIFNRRRQKKEDGPTVDDLQRKIGQLTMDLDFLKKYGENEREGEALPHFSKQKYVRFAAVRPSRADALKLLLCRKGAQRRHRTYE